MKSRLVGIIILVVVVIGAIVAYVATRNPQGLLGPVKQVALQIYAGSEKANLLDDQEFKDLLSRNFGIQVKYAKAGSQEMMRLDHTSYGGLWPSSALALDLYRGLQNGAAVKNENVFNSPLVIYTWDKVVDVLSKKGLVTAQTGGWFTLDLKTLVPLLVKKTSWASLGLPALYGDANLIATDPARSNSGLLFAALAATVLAGATPSDQTDPKIWAQVRQLYRSMGHLEYSTGVLFEQYMTQGIGSFPMMVGYENQLIEFAVSNPDLWNKLKSRIRILYPVPTVWSAHPFISLDADGTIMMQALLDPKVQELAWKRHGFRSGIPATISDPASLGVTGLAPEVTQVVPLPSSQVMEAFVADFNQP